MNIKIIASISVAIVFLLACYWVGGGLVEGQASKQDASINHKKETMALSPSPKKLSNNFSKTNKYSNVTPRQQLKPKVNLPAKGISPSEQKLLEDLQSALDEEAFDKLVSIAKNLKNSPSPETRSKVVEALRWFKQPALPMLRDMLRDPDPGVAREASDGWKDAVEEITDEPTKAQELYDGMVQMVNEESLEECIMGYYSLDDGLALGYIVQLVQSGNPVAAQVGRAGYEHIASEPYTNPETAQRWIEEWRKNNPLVDSAP